MTARRPRPTSLAQLGALLGDPVRAAILYHLSDGSRRPAGELARLAGASPQAASAHLSHLLENGLLAAEPQGRHRFFRLASGEAAELLEELTNFVDAPRPRSHAVPQLRQARLCYDHLAGEFGVRLFERFSAAGLFVVGSETVDLSPSGRSWCRSHGIDLTPLPGSRRPVVRLCLDWTERRYHAGGHFGAALARWMTETRMVVPSERHRALVVTQAGLDFLDKGLPQCFAAP